MIPGEAFQIASPYYNLVLAVIVAILFVKLFARAPKSFYIKPWRMFFTGFVLFIVETIMTVLRGLGIITFPGAIFPLLEMIVIGLFIYMLLLQKQYVKTGKRD